MTDTQEQAAMREALAQAITWAGCDCPVSMLPLPWYEQAVTALTDYDYAKQQASRAQQPVDVEALTETLFIKCFTPYSGVCTFDKKKAANLIREAFAQPKAVCE